MRRPINSTLSFTRRLCSAARARSGNDRVVPAVTAKMLSQGAGKGGAGKKEGVLGTIVRLTDGGWRRCIRVTPELCRGVIFQGLLMSVKEICEPFNHCLLGVGAEPALAPPSSFEQARRESHR